MTADDWDAVFLFDCSNQSLAIFCDWLEEQGEDPGHIMGLRGLAELASVVADSKEDPEMFIVQDAGSSVVTEAIINANGTVSVITSGRSRWARCQHAKDVCAAMVLACSEPLSISHPALQWWESRTRAVCVRTTHHDCQFTFPL